MGGRVKDKESEKWNRAEKFYPGGVLKSPWRGGLKIIRMGGTGFDGCPSPHWTVMTQLSQTKTFSNFSSKSPSGIVNVLLIVFNVFS